jgi:acyl-CoA dehydrogenase
MTFTDVLSVPRPSWMTEDLVLLEEQVERFLDAEFVPQLERWHEQGMMDREAWSKLGEAGLLCAGIPEEYGGAGGTFAHETVINRVFALKGFDQIGAPLHSGIVAPYILKYGTEEQKNRWLPRMATGELVSAIAMTEPGTRPSSSSRTPSSNWRSARPKQPSAACSTTIASSGTSRAISTRPPPPWRSTG